MKQFHDPDLVYGMENIAVALKMPVRRARYLRTLNELPVFPLYPGSRILCARRTVLAAHLAALEAQETRARSAA